MSNYIGTGPVSRENRKYFYKITRNSNQELILTKIDLNSSTETVVVNNPELETNNVKHAFQGFNTDYVVINTDESHNIIDPPLGVSQYKVRNDDINYFVDNNGNLIARINAKYTYS
jgi:hypothetical protein